MIRPVKTVAVISALAGALAGGSTLASADQSATSGPEMKQEPQTSQPAAGLPRYGPGYGMGMMRGYGPGYGMGMMNEGYRPGYGMGMMNDGYGPAYGMGMMGGYGPGYGVMRGHGPGFGPMGPFWVPNLTSDQIDQMQKIRDAWMEKMHPLIQEVIREREKIVDMYSSGNRDPAQFGKVFSQLADLQRQSIEARIDTQNQLEALLTKEQKEWLEQRGR